MTKKIKKTVKTHCEKFTDFYKKNYKKILIIPLLIFLISLGIIAHTTIKEGVPIYRDVSLKGGLSAVIDIQTQQTAHNLKTNFETQNPKNSFTISERYENGEKIGFIIDTDLKEETFKPQLEKQFKTEFTSGKNYNSNYIAPSLSSSFFTQAIYILAVSLILMATVIFLYFRKLVPSSAVILSAIFDIIVTIAALDLIQYKISIAGVGALLMLIGYSIDTDVLLTNRTYKEKGNDYFEKAGFAFKTGTVMSLTTLITGIAAMILTNSDIIFEIALILVIGLIVDFISTWLQNASILLWWLNSKKSK